MIAIHHESGLGVWLWSSRLLELNQWITFLLVTMPCYPYPRCRSTCPKAHHKSTRLQTVRATSFVPWGRLVCLCVTSLPMCHRTRCKICLTKKQRVIYYFHKWIWHYEYSVQWELLTLGQLICISYLTPWHYNLSRQFSYFDCARSYSLFAETAVTYTCWGATSCPRTCPSNTVTTWPRPRQWVVSQPRLCWFGYSYLWNIYIHRFQAGHPSLPNRACSAYWHYPSARILLNNYFHKACLPLACSLLPSAFFNKTFSMLTGILLHGNLVFFCVHDDDK